MEKLNSEAEGRVCGMGATKNVRGKKGVCEDISK